MGPTNGSDSERMMAEIEAFLRTGEAPPPAPEPVTEPPERGHPPKPRVQRPARRHPLRPRWLKLPSSAPPGRAAPAEPPRWTALRVVIVVALVAGLLVLPALYTRDSSKPTSNVGSDRASAAPAGSGYRFLRLNRSGTPLRWNPCAPIYYQTDLSSAPPYAAHTLQLAIEKISAATGISFVDDGPTKASPGAAPKLGPDGQVGPVEIAWAGGAKPSSAKSTTTGGEPVADSVAQGVPVAAVDQSTGHGLYVTGTVVIGSSAAHLRDGFVPGGLGVLLLHELGHLVGLANVDDASQIMNPGVLATSTVSFGAGDLAGLKRLGVSSGCLVAPTNPSLVPVH